MIKTLLKHYIIEQCLNKLYIPDIGLTEYTLVSIYDAKINKINYLLLPFNASINIKPDGDILIHGLVHYIGYATHVNSYVVGSRHIDNQSIGIIESNDRYQMKIVRIHDPIKYLESMCDGEIIKDIAIL